MTLVFDTSALSRLLSNDDEVVRAVSKKQYDKLLIPLSTDAEIRYGFANGQRNEVNVANYDLFKRNFGLEIIVPDQDTSMIYADIATWCRQNGIALSNNDIWIASTCVQVGGTLITTDKDFKNLTQIRMIDI